MNLAEHVKTLVVCIAIIFGTANGTALSDTAKVAEGSVALTPSAHDTTDQMSGKDSLTSLSLNQGEFEQSPRGGARVDVFLHDGNEMFGDLLRVQDTSLAVYVYKDYSKRSSRIRKSGTYLIEFSEVDKIVLRGRSKVLEIGRAHV
jgi:hypothetical protein